MLNSQAASTVNNLREENNIIDLIMESAETVGKECYFIVYGDVDGKIDRTKSFGKNDSLDEASKNNLMIQTIDRAKSAKKMVNFFQIFNSNHGYLIMFRSLLIGDSPMRKVFIAVSAQNQDDANKVMNGIIDTFKVKNMYKG